MRRARKNISRYLRSWSQWETLTPQCGLLVDVRHLDVVQMDPEALSESGAAERAVSRWCLWVSSRSIGTAVLVNCKRKPAKSIRERQEVEVWPVMGDNG